MLVVPEGLRASHVRYFGEATAAWMDALPGLAARCVDAWGLRPDGEVWHGTVALVVPVRRADGTPAVLKLQPVDRETVGEPVALRAWGGRGAVRLLEHDAESGSMLLERLDAARGLGGVADVRAALRTLSGVLAQLHAVAAPPGLRHLADIASGLLERAPRAIPRLPDPADRELARTCVAALREVLPEPGDRLLHWDLHYDNVLGAPDGAGWVAIDPKPLVGDPGFELLAALHNRWPETDVLPHFDLMTEVLGLDRGRAARWTLARVLQNLVWAAEEGTASWSAHPDRLIAEALLSRELPVTGRGRCAGRR
ncbi:hydroxyurea phosphotransferase [Actinoplanes cyaneus]|uniref:Hydroxyurea phosphotransferase n=1 Tax=Actinoplanes cyaneus TaxID=52696 RepID=A0A919IUE4_9ACTN|nr:aminoglycoside phosphotransferase family protein [Actinoplanes cyaneus]MCW2143901.1 streptomycin 6-kinase [Actinoplanes cyaneus]GID70682.1 hydroxyurea phosphotransferase [Actinoplanes cyaneus]